MKRGARDVIAAVSSSRSPREPPWWLKPAGPLRKEQEPPRDSISGQQNGPHPAKRSPPGAVTAANQPGRSRHKRSQPAGVSAAKQTGPVPAKRKLARPPDPPAGLQADEQPRPRPATFPFRFRRSG